MAQIVAALFRSYDAASGAVRELESAGFSYRNISIVANVGDEKHLIRFGTTDDASKGASSGIGIGGAVGGGLGLLAGLGALTLPGLGPMVAAGWLAATATGTAAGAAIGGIVGMLTAAGLSDEDAQIYAHGLGQGGTIVAARVDEELKSDVQSILSKHQPTDVSIAEDRSPDEVSLNAGRVGSEMHSAHKVADSGRVDPSRHIKPAHSLIASDEVRGTSIYDRNGKHIGVVERLMIDKSSGQVAYVVMSFGGFLGMGTDYESLPWASLEYDHHLGGYRTDLTEDWVGVPRNVTD
jgi:hypothetical protein